MGVDKIVKIVGVLFAIVAAFVAIPESAAIVAILGIAGGYFIAEDDRNRFLVAAIALNLAHGGLGAIWGVGGYITTALEGVNGLFLAAAATVIVLGVVDRLKP
jgi:xanthosine utilization system XapX-like protein